jgi:hypothetical protein
MRTPMLAPKPPDESVESTVTDTLPRLALPPVPKPDTRRYCHNFMIRLSQETQDGILKLVAMSGPFATKHGVARVALEIGLELLLEHPELLSKKEA